MTAYAVALRDIVPFEARKSQDLLVDSFVVVI